MKRIFLNADLVFTFALTAALFTACDEGTEADVSIFEFVQFKDDAIVSGAESATITFYAFRFDNDKNSWNIKVYDEDGNEEASSIQIIEKTHMNAPIEEENLYLIKTEIKTAAKLEPGNYTLYIENKNTGQVLIESFLVVKKSLPSSIISNQTSLINLSLIYNVESSEGGEFFKQVSPKFLFAQGSEIYLETERINEISGVYFVSKDGADEFGLDVDIQDNTSISFTIPEGVVADNDNYYMMIMYNHVMTDVAYFPNSVGIMAEKLPVITSVNKEVFDSREETVVLTGENFRFQIDEKFITNRYAKVETNFGLVVEQEWKNGKNGLDISTLYIWNNEYTINEEGTRIECVLNKMLRPENNELQIGVRTYAGYSNMKTIKVNE